MFKYVIFGLALALAACSQPAPAPQPSANPSADAVGGPHENNPDTKAD